MNIRCPHCKEALAISEEEIDLSVACPICRKAFCWGKILEAREKEKEAKRERLRQIQGRSRHSQLGGAVARRRRNEVKRQMEIRARTEHEAAQIETAALREIKWHCAECGKGLCQLDFDEQTAFYDNVARKAYCMDHTPAWLFARAEERRVGTRRHLPGPLVEEVRSGAGWIVLSIILAAIIIIVGYIAYTEYNKYWIKKEAEKALKEYEERAKPELDKLKRDLEKWR
jgi:phage FluMu protein Com/pterin-4a-carbinolamine dehydratase